MTTSSFCESTKSNIENKCYSILKEHFNHTSFRANQLETIKNTINGHDSLVVMATGSGKSLCYQIPPIYLNQTAIIISPLVSLSQNQVNSLRNKNIPAVSITSNTTNNDRNNAFKHNKYKLIYLTPEGIESSIETLKQFHESFGISCIGIDESHCVVEWGHDFRPSYQRLFRLRDNLPNVPILALTATATKDVQYEIIKNLKLKTNKLLHICSTFNRINLTYYIKKKQSLKSDLCRMEYYETGSTIIYCSTRNECDNVSNVLCTQGINAASYHGGLEWDTREDVQSKWENGYFQCIVATIAFGMGIDKGDIRYVIHYGIPKSIESYYQQTGRAGRDGQISQCILYWNDRDFAHCEWIINQSQTDKGREIALKGVQKIKSLIYSSQCRINIVLNHFGECIDGNECINRCDNCIANKDRNNNKLKEIDFTKEAKIMIQCVIEVGPYWTITQIGGVCKGSNTCKTRKIRNVQRKKAFGLLSNYTVEWIKGLLRNLIQKDILCEIIGKAKNPKYIYKKIGVTQKGRDILLNKIRLQPWVPDRDMIQNSENTHDYQNDLGNVVQKTGRAHTTKQNVGKGWSFEDDEHLWHLRDLDKKELAEYYGKTVGAIRSRLKHLQNPTHKAYERMFESNHNVQQNNNVQSQCNNNCMYSSGNTVNNNNNNERKRMFAEYQKDKDCFNEMMPSMKKPKLDHDNNINNHEKIVNKDVIIEIIQKQHNIQNGISINDLSQKLNVSSNDLKLQNVLKDLMSSWQIYKKNDCYFMF